MNVTIARRCMVSLGNSRICRNLAHPISGLVNQGTSRKYAACTITLDVRVHTFGVSAIVYPRPTDTGRNVSSMLHEQPVCYVFLVLFSDHESREVGYASPHHSSRRPVSNERSSRPPPRGPELVRTTTDRVKVSTNRKDERRELVA